MNIVLFNNLQESYRAQDGEELMFAIHSSWMICNSAVICWWHGSGVGYNNPLSDLNFIEHQFWIVNQMCAVLMTVEMIVTYDLDCHFESCKGLWIFQIVLLQVQMPIAQRNWCANVFQGQSSKFKFQTPTLGSAPIGPARTKDDMETTEP